MIILNSNAQYIAKKIIDHGGQCYLVGGAVRDDLMGKVPHDIDIATSLDYIELHELFKDDHPVTIGAAFGVLMVRGVEISQFRQDVYDDQEPHTTGADSVIPAASIVDDLARRDFCFNAMARALLLKDGVIVVSEELIDPFGGKQNLFLKEVKFVGDPHKRIKEDPCRMLRAMRFCATFDYPIEDAADRAIEANRALIFIISKERIRDEIIKTLQRSKKPSIFIKYLSRYGLLQYVLPALAVCNKVEQNDYHAEDVLEHCLGAMDSVSPRYWKIRLASLLHDTGKPQCITEDEGGRHFYGHEHFGSKIARDMLYSLRFPQKDIQYVTELVNRHMYFFETETKTSTYRSWMNNLEVPVRDLLRLRIADRRGNKKKIGIPGKFKMVLRKIREIEWDEKQIKLKHLAINGNDIITLGVPSGPAVGKLLASCLQLVIATPGRNTKEELINYVKSIRGLNNEQSR